MRKVQNPDVATRYRAGLAPVVAGMGCGLAILGMKEEYTIYPTWYWLT